MQKIKVVSSFFKMAFLILAFIMPVLFVCAWLNNPAQLVLLNHFIELNYIPLSYTGNVQQNIVHGFTAAQKWRGVFVSLIPLFLQVYLFLILSKLFSRYEKLQIFTLQSVSLIKQFGFVLFIYQLFQPIFEFLMGVALTWDFPKGYRIATITISQNDIAMLFMPLLVILIAWIMAEGCRLQEENQLTI